jgi:hypothetical protein
MTVSSSLLVDAAGSAALPGCAPGGAVTFFCFAKRKSPKKRRAEARAPAGFLALLASDGVGLNSLRSDNARPDPPDAALLSPATRQGNPDSQKPIARTPQGRAMARPCGVRYWVPLAVMRRRVAQGRAEKGAHMFEPAGRVCADPARAEQRSVPVAQRRADESGSPFFWVLCFGEAKKSTSPAGARPGNAALPGHHAESRV